MIYINKSTTSLLIFIFFYQCISLLKDKIIPAFLLKVIQHIFSIQRPEALQHVLSRLFPLVSYLVVL